MWYGSPTSRRHLRVVEASAVGTSFSRPFRPARAEGPFRRSSKAADDISLKTRGALLVGLIKPSPILGPLSPSGESWAFSTNAVGPEVRNEPAGPHRRGWGRCSVPSASAGAPPT